jgi:hypothetical protein
MKRKLKYSTTDELKKSSFNFVNEICKIWSSQKHPPKVRISGVRIHHHYLGIIGFVVSKILKDSHYEQDKTLGRHMEGGSMALLMDDHLDLQKNLKKLFRNILR